MNGFSSDFELVIDEEISEVRFSSMSVSQINRTSAK